MKRLLAFAPLIVLVALAGLFFGWSLRRDPNVKPAALVGRPLPATMVTPLAGGPSQPLTAALDGPTVVNVFASWCVPCRVEGPTLMRLKAQGVRVVGLAWKDKPEDTRAFLNDVGDPFAVVVTDQPGTAGVDLGVSGVPETYLVDAKGKIVAKQSAPLSEAEADALAAQWRALKGR